MLADPPVASSPSLAEARSELIDGVRSLVGLGLMVGTTGNMSTRAGGRVLITPTRMSYREMEPGDLVCIDPSAPAAGRNRNASREVPLHLEIYRRRPDVGAIAHTHSPHATAWSCLGEPLEPPTTENEYYGIGPIRTSPPAAPGSPELAAAAAGSLGASSALLLGNHGVLTTGPSPRAATELAEVVEHLAQVAWLLRGS